MAKASGKVKTAVIGKRVKPQRIKPNIIVGSNTYSIAGMCVPTPAVSNRKTRGPVKGTINIGGVKKNFSRKTKPGSTKAQDQKTYSSGFVFVVKVGKSVHDSEWRYVTYEYATVLSTAATPAMIFPYVTNQMREMWKRVAIDGAMEFDVANVHRETLKLVELHVNLFDADDQIFFDEATRDDSLKIAAMSKLSADEAKLLGLETEYTMMRIMQGPFDETKDERLMSSIRNDLEVLSIREVRDAPTLD